MSILIGRGSNCQQKQKLTDMSISRRHATLEKIAENRWKIKDIGSSYGTYVNGMQVVETEVGPDTPIVLGNFPTTVRELLGGRPVQQKPTGKVISIQHLQYIYDNYQDGIKNIAKKRQKQQLMRMLPMQLVMPLALGLSGIFITDQGQGPIIKGAIMVAVMGLTGAMSMKVISNVDSQTDEQQDLVQQFQIDYTCPECKNFMGMTTPYKALLKRGKCPFCKAEFSESRHGGY